MAGPNLILAPDDYSGRKLGKYEILCRLSLGGMSEIFLAFQRGLAGFRKFVVLKQILPDIKGEEEFVRMFLDEAKITAAFAHPNIAQVFDLDIADGELFLAMEFVPGATLVEVARACRQANEPIPIGFTLAAVRDTAVALHYAHTFTDPMGRPVQVIHRDIAEKNIMVTYDGTTKLLDFGIAKAIGRASRTSVGMVKGTSGYMSPEQILGEPLDPRSDIFSLGVVLHECLTGMRLFHGKKPEDAMLQAIKADVAPPSKHNAEITADLDAVVLRALQRARDDRYSTALELARAIERVASPLIWHPEQSSQLITRLFSDRRDQTRALMSQAQVQGTEHTGELRLAELFNADEFPPAPAPVAAPRAPPPPLPSAPPPLPPSPAPAAARPPVPWPEPPAAPVPVPAPVTLPSAPAPSPALPATAPLAPASSVPAAPVRRSIASRIKEIPEDEPAPEPAYSPPPARRRPRPPRDGAGSNPARAPRKPPPPVPDVDADFEPTLSPDARDERTLPRATLPPGLAHDRTNPEVTLPPGLVDGEKTLSGVGATQTALRRQRAEAGSTAMWVTGFVLLAALCGGGYLVGLHEDIARVLGLDGETADVAAMPPPPQPIAMRGGPQPLPGATLSEPVPVADSATAPVPVPAAEPVPALANGKPPAPAPATTAAADATVLEAVDFDAVAAPLVEEKKPAAAKPAPAPARTRTVRAPVKRTAPAASATDTEPAKAAAPVGSGSLTLITEPWSTVFMGRQELGITPMVKQKLAAGRHTLRLVDAEGKAVSLPVEIKAGEDTKVRVPLSVLKPL